MTPTLLNAETTAQHADAGEVRTTEGALRWCPAHERAWTHTMYRGWHWHPFTATTLRIALMWARYFHCAIRVEEVPCDVCAEAQSAKETA